MKRRAIAATLASALSICAFGQMAAEASPPPIRTASMAPWTDEGDVPIPSWVQSVVPKAPPTAREDPALYISPGAVGNRRGSARIGSHLPIFAATRGPGCQGRWWMVGPMAWICSDVAELSADEPGDDELLPRSDGLPYRYAFAGKEGAYGYLDAARATDDAPDIALEPGWGVALVEERTVQGERWGKTRRGRWIALRELAVARPIAFHGEVVLPAHAALDFAWVNPERANVFSSKSGTKATTLKTRFEVVQLASTAETPLAPIEVPSAKGGKGAKPVKVVKATADMVQLAPANGASEASGEVWIHARDLARPHLATPPEEVLASADPAHEKWIDVELSSQTLVAYEGTTPVFATLVSTGKGPQGSPTATPIGTHRIWVKLATSTMDNVEDDDVGAVSTVDEPEKRYSIEDVPWVQFFAKGVALHAAFWHQDFGHTHSHGCVNLAPLDAARLFKWTSPHLSNSWSAALPSPIDDGTYVRVRP